MLHDVKGNSMTRRKAVTRALIVCAVALMLALTPFVGFGTAKADGGLTLSTTYPGVTISPGQDVTFDLVVKNESGVPQNVALSLPTLPDGWTAYFTGNSKPVSRVFVDNAEDANTSKVSLVVDVPDDAAEGTQSIVAAATGENGAVSNLNMDVTISSQEFTQGALTAQYQELEGSTSSSFSFTMTLKNNSNDQQGYSLTSGAPEGWQVKFSSSAGQQIASLNVDSGRSESITVGVTPPTDVEPGKYDIPVSAISADETLDMNFTVNITGTYGMTLSTPTGLLTTDVIAGKESTVTLTVENTGSADLSNIALTAKSVPTDWTVTFDKDKIETLAAGQSAQVTATIKAANDAITGDYAVSISAKTSQASSQADFRVTVKTSTVWGIVGIVIIAAVIVALVLVFRKFGRR
jgi:uncharacterized membrane protein